MLETKIETKIEAKHEVKNETKNEVTSAASFGEVATFAGKAPRRISAADWLRVVGGFKAPFGHDGLPTVWG